MSTWSGVSVWEVRTTGSDTNGGAFIYGASGQDYSQQNSPQYSGSDLEVNAANNLQIKSATAGSPVANDVGNIICISAGTGWTLQWYEIVSQDGTWWTLDRSPAAAGTTGGTFAVGGALASPGLAIDIGDTNYRFNDARSIVYIESGTYLVDNNTNLASNTAFYIGRSIVIGYDQINGRGNKPSVNPIIRASGSYTGTLHLNSFSINATYLWSIARYLDFDGNLQTTSDIAANVGEAHDCRFYNFLGNGVTGTSSILHRCYVDGSNATSNRVATAVGFAHECVCIGAFRTTALRVDYFAENCICSGTTGGSGYSCLAVQRHAYIRNCIVYNASSTGISAGSHGSRVENNIAVNCDFPFHTGSGSGSVYRRNYYYGGTQSTITAAYPNWLEQPISLAEDPFVDSANGVLDLDPDKSTYSILTANDSYRVQGTSYGATVGPYVQVGTGGGSILHPLYATGRR